jgi:hypothetical protein
MRLSSSHTEEVGKLISRGNLSGKTKRNTVHRPKLRKGKAETKVTTEKGQNTSPN